MSTLARNGHGSGTPYDVSIPITINSNPQECAQIKLQDEFQLGLGEWFIDTTQGIPYVQQILGQKNPNITNIRALFRTVILNTPGIVSVQEIRVFLNSARQFSYTFSATDNTGAIIQGGDTPFVVGNT